jgi:hypothetical protein
LESRLAILLTKGYFAGWLNFDYTNTFSRARERLILNQLEKELITDVVKLRTLAQAHYIQVNPKDGGKSTQAALNDYSEITLPYIYKQDKIKSDKPIPQTPDEWKAVLANINKKKDEQSRNAS